MEPFITAPHGQHKIMLVEDAEKPGNRIYDMQDLHDATERIGLLGSEIESLCQWWSSEKNRIGEDATEEDSEGDE
jgi:hypothetical protein